MVRWLQPIAECSVYPTAAVAQATTTSVTGHHDYRDNAENGKNIFVKLEKYNTGSRSINLELLTFSGFLQVQIKFKCKSASTDVKV